MLKLTLVLSNASVQSLLVDTTSGIQLQPSVPVFDDLGAEDDQFIEFRYIVDCQETTLSEYNKIHSAFREIAQYFEVSKDNVEEDGDYTQSEIYFSLFISKEKFMKYLTNSLFSG